MVDAGGLNPPGPKGPCGFESRPGYFGLATKLTWSYTQNLRLWSSFMVPGSDSGPFDCANGVSRSDKP